MVLRGSLNIDKLVYYLEMKGILSSLKYCISVVKHNSAEEVWIEKVNNSTTSQNTG